MDNSNDNIPAVARSVFFVRLPCWKIYPGGAIHVADPIHKRHPAIRQCLLDQALAPPAERRQRLSQHSHALQPEIVAFSWRG